MKINVSLPKAWDKRSPERNLRTDYKMRLLLFLLSETKIVSQTGVKAKPGPTVEEDKDCPIN